MTLFFYRFLQHPYSVEPASSRQSPFPVSDCLIYAQLYIIRRNSVLVTNESKKDLGILEKDAAEKVA